MQVDESQQTFKIHADEDRVWKRAALNPTLASLQKGMFSERFISASMLAFKAKQFDDGLYAAVDLAAQQGAGKYLGKISLLRELTQALARGRMQGENESGGICCRSAGRHNSRTIQHELVVAEEIERFLGDTEASKALGFYTWTPELSRIFQHDRMLQSKVSPAQPERNGRFVSWSLV